MRGREKKGERRGEELGKEWKRGENYKKSKRELKKKRIWNKDNGRNWKKETHTHKKSERITR